MTSSPKEMNVEWETRFYEVRAVYAHCVVESRTRSATPGSRSRAPPSPATPLAWCLSLGLQSFKLERSTFTLMLETQPRGLAPKKAGFREHQLYEHDRDRSRVSRWGQRTRLVPNERKANSRASAEEMIFKTVRSVLGSEPAGGTGSNEVWK